VSALSRHLARLLFLSYRFSQGGIGTQNRMLLYIERHHQPELFSGPNLAEVKALTWKLVAPYFLNQRTHPATAIPWADNSPEATVKTELLVRNELAGLFERFTDRSQLTTFDSSPTAIAESVIVMDADYLQRPGGRAGDSETLKIKVSPYRRDPFASIFIEHGVLGRTTHSVEFDAMFAELGDVGVLRRLDAHTLWQLQRVIAIYEARHADGDDERMRSHKAACAALLDGK
jgi:hypothetical protein